MAHSLTDKDLTALDVKALAARIYEPLARHWENGYWECPQCGRLNAQHAPQCACGITRDGLPEFCDR